ncbi:nuclear pore protein-like protein [Colletotrichum karsti]|uniref:Nuclear pore protein-like protein n=1 Tax=Colletotrichum karsti TaxID=1095194 RepID=A0A9P6HYP9_9PEZI|nr:nuclear pore protein-like protein [Colletotrichum karsti]KAF9873762.1 nuclear pore protein-like protein [Colletotrichum karsti]
MASKSNLSDARKSTRWQSLRSTMRAPHAFEMDPRGDLTLEVGSNTNADANDEEFEEDEGNNEDGTRQLFRVCSKSLARSSVVFCKMLFGHFSETDQGLVSLPDDHIEPMFLALLIIHGRFAKVPSFLTIEELFELVIITNKYDMTNIVRPWINNWVPRLKGIELCPDKDLLAWIAWEVGADRVFEKMALDIAYECRVNKDGDILDTDGKLMKTNIYLDAAGILDTIARARNKAISGMFYPLRLGVKKILEGNGCSSIEDKVRCDSTVLGSIIIACKAANVDPAPLLAGNTPPYLGSVRELTAEIKRMEFTNVDSHLCNTILAAKVSADIIFTRTTSLVSLNELDHLEKRAKISGWTRLN